MRKLAAVLVAITVLIWLLINRISVTSDHVLIQRWKENRASFSKLLEWTKNDAEGLRRSPEGIGFLDKMGIQSASGNQHVGWRFVAYRSGSILGGKEKGYVYRETKPDNIVSNLDSLKEIKSMTLYHRHSEGNWYIWLLHDD